MAVFRFMVLDDEGQRVARFETSDTDWRSGDTFDLEEQAWRIVEILQEVSTMVAYDGIWVAASIVDDELESLPLPIATRPTGIA